MGYVVFLILLVAYNNVANRWPPFNGPLYVPLNATATALVIVAGTAGFGLSHEAIGLGFALGDALLGFALGASIVAVIAIGLAIPKTRRRLADERVAGLSGASLLYQVLVRIPVGTALLEEIAFRGVAFAAASHLGNVEAAIISSAAFGLWHIAPTLNLIEANDPGASLSARTRAVLGAIAFTFCGGLLLCWLRRETGSLAAPFLLHATLNSGSTLVAVRAHALLRNESVEV